VRFATAFAVALVVPHSVAGQVAISASLSADTVAIGDAFEVQVTITVPPGQLVYFPDSLDATEGYAPLGAVEWTVETNPDGSSILSVAYALVAFDVGVIATAEFDIVTERGDGTPDAVVGSWSALPDSQSRQGQEETWSRVSVPAQSLWVASVLLVEDGSQSPRPRPADDVSGGDWHWPSLFFLVASTLVLGGVLTVGAREVLGRPGDTWASGVAEPLSARAIALDALDRLLASERHADGRVHEFYASSSDIVRRYVETLDATWDSTRTSSELMRALDEKADRGGADPQFMAEMHAAETVKFGMLRPDTPSAEAHLNTLRDWVERSGTSDA